MNRLKLAVSIPLAALACLISFDFSQADVVSTDWKTAGDGLLTRDLDNDLEWLDFSETMIPGTGGNAGSNRTFNDVSSQFGVGGEFEGFRHATEAEIIAFWTSAGIPDINVGGTADNFVPLTNLIDLMGLTSTGSGGIIPFSVGIYSGSIQPNTHQTAMLEILDNLGRARTQLTSIDDDQSNLTGGHWLVRPSSIPEPASSMFFGCITFIALSRRRRWLSGTGWGNETA